ncbi:MAG: DUF2339 domain-containing protein [Bacteroidales bacterium]|nr:DUF2339 domain-containing protein [Bacteroidales bacterium]
MENENNNKDFLIKLLLLTQQRLQLDNQIEKILREQLNKILDSSDTNVQTSEIQNIEQQIIQSVEKSSEINNNIFDLNKVEDNQTKTDTQEPDFILNDNNQIVENQQNAIFNDTNNPIVENQQNTIDTIPENTNNEIVEIQQNTSEPILENNTEIVENQQELSEPISEKNTEKFENQQDKKKVLPPEFKQIDNISQSTDNEERNIGVNWMSRIGIIISIIGVLFCIKGLIHRDLLGPLGRIILGYLSCAVMMVIGKKVEKKHPVLSQVFNIGGISLAYGVTCIAHGVDLFRSEITLAVLWAISLILGGIAYIKNRKMLFNFSLLAFFVSPFCSGYSFDSKINLTIFWLSLLFIVNTLMIIVYKTKSWSSSLIVAFTSTLFVLIVKFLDGADLPHIINVSYFGLCYILFYIGYTVLYFKHNPNYNIKYLVFSIINTLVLVVFSAIEFHSKFEISTTYVIISVLLTLVSVYFLQKNTQDNILYKTPFSISIVLINVALIITLCENYVAYLLAIFALEIIITALLSSKNNNDYFKRMSLSLIFVGIVMFFIVMFLEYSRYETPQRFLNQYFICGFILSITLFYVGIKLLPETYQKINIILSLSTLYLVLVIEIFHSTYGLDNTPNSNGALICCTLFTSIYFALLSFISEKNTYISQIKDFSRLSILFTILFFCATCLILLSKFRDIIYLQIHWKTWRYISLIIIGLVIGYIFTIRNKDIKIKYFPQICDIIITISIVWIVSTEIVNIMAINGSKENYGLWLSIWFGLSALILIFLGLKLDMKHLRILGFVLSGITTAKLFFYDIWNSVWWIKAIVFLAVGLIFLTVSHLYSHFKKLK